MGADNKLVFESSIEGVFIKGHGSKLTPSLKAKFRELGVDLDKPLKPTYPLAAVNECTRLLRKFVYAHEPDDLKAYKAIGSATLDGYFDTMLGRALSSVMRVIGFRKVIDRLPQNFSSGNNYQQAKLKWLGPCEVELELIETSPHPGLNVGVMERAFGHYFKAPGFQVEIAREHPPGATYRLRWSEPAKP
jgi:uncharacterized protein (TIGR02265 family)